MKFLPCVVFLDFTVFEKGFLGLTFLREMRMMRRYV